MKISKKVVHACEQRGGAFYPTARFAPLYYNHAITVAMCAPKAHIAAPFDLRWAPKLCLRRRAPFGAHFTVCGIHAAPKRF